MHPFFLPDLAGERIRTFHAEADNERRSRRARDPGDGEGRALRGRLRRGPRSRRHGCPPPPGAGGVAAVPSRDPPVRVSSSKP